MTITNDTTSDLARADRLDHDELAQIAAALGRDAATVRSIEPGERRRWTYQIRESHYEAVAIAWPSGTGLRMHDHDGSSAAIFVVNGRLRERYLGTNGRMHVRWLESGETTCLAGDHVHEVINLDDHEVVSVHVYSPPIVNDDFRTDREIDIAPRSVAARTNR